MSNEFTVDLPEELAMEVAAAAKDLAWNIQKTTTKEHLAFLNKVRPKLRNVKNFWTVALLNHPGIAGIATKSDREALASLIDVELVQDHNDPRAYELIFHFDDNDFFTNKTLSKKYTLPKSVAPAPADGSITDEIRGFDNDDLLPSATTIDWKEGKNLIEQHPRKSLANLTEADDGDDFDGDMGSFFHWFTTEGDIFNTGPTLVDEILQDPLEWFEGPEEYDPDEDDELDEEDDEDEGSVDLEDEDDDKPAKKKQRT